MNDGGPPSNSSSTSLVRDSALASMSQTSLQYLTSSTEPSLKRIKLEHTPSSTSLGPPTLSYHDLGAYGSSSALHTGDATAALGALKKQDSIGLMCKDEENDVGCTKNAAEPLASVEQAATQVATTVSSTDSLHQQAQSQTHSSNISPTALDSGKASPSESLPVALDAPSSPQAPLKVTKMSHLRKKYMQELEYMLCEFQKLERQLLGAKSATSESAGSKERREKLHSFILHLQETIDSIKNGCVLEAQGKSTVEGSAKEGIALGAALADPSKEKEEEENVQKLEEHILANLLPVKVRLKKQLAAQQGAKHNPAGMPVGRRNLVAPTASKAGTFAEAAELKRQAAVAATQPPAKPVNPDDTQFGKSLKGTGSSLTKKLHGPKLGSSSRLSGHGVGNDNTESGGNNKVLFAGMAIGSDQVESSISAASSVHQLVIQDRALLELAQEPKFSENVDTSIRPPDHAAASSQVVGAATTAFESGTPAPKHQEPENTAISENVFVSPVTTAVGAKRKTKRRKKRKRKESSTKPATKKRGPRTVEYMCALCNEVYNSTCDFNPWWALAQHECPKCRKMQVPRVDISAPANAIEYHPALLAHADDNGAAAKAAAAAAAAAAALQSETDSQGSESDDNLDNLMSDSDSGDSEESDIDALGAMSPPEKAENERFGAEYSGPKLEDGEASRLLVLMAHASTCPCQHKQKEQQDICRSVKWMLLHVRDCPGTTASFDVCPFPWCRKIKHLMYHLVSCKQPDSCPICMPKDLPENLNRLRGLNNSRIRGYRERLVAQAKTMVAARARSLKAKQAAAAGVQHAAAPRAGANQKPVAPTSSTSPVTKQVVIPQSVKLLEPGRTGIEACSTPRTTNSTVKSITKAADLPVPAAVKSSAVSGGNGPSPPASHVQPSAESPEDAVVGKNVADQTVSSPIADQPKAESLEVQ